MKIQTYDDIKVTLVRATQDPAQLIKTACDLTQTKQIVIDKFATRSLIKYLIQASHGSILEHCSVTLSLEGISRSLLAQITRHRVGSFTSASQHYADYRDMPMVVDPDAEESDDDVYWLELAFRYAIKSYENLIDQGVPIYEARQVLPNACAVNLIWTVNLRSLQNFFEQRLCRRNVKEMIIVATKVYRAVEAWYPEFTDCCGPYCYPSGECNQGKMSCGWPYVKGTKDDCK